MEQIIKIHVVRTLAFLFCFIALSAQADVSGCREALEPHEEENSLLNQTEVTATPPDEVSELSDKKKEEIINNLNIWTTREIAETTLLIKNEMNFVKYEKEIKLAYHESELIEQLENFVNQRRRLTVQRGRLIAKSEELIEQQRIQSEVETSTLLEEQVLDLIEQVLKEKKELIHKQIELINKHIQLTRQKNPVEYSRIGDDGLADKRIELIEKRVALMIQQKINFANLKTRLTRILL